MMDEVVFSIATGDIVNHDGDTAQSEEFVKVEEENVFNAFKAEMVNKHGDIVRSFSLLNFSYMWISVMNGAATWT